MTHPKTCRYMVGRVDELTGQWTFGYLCGKPATPGLAPGTRAHEMGACLEHVAAGTRTLGFR